MCDAAPGEGVVFQNNLPGPGENVQVTLQVKGQRRITFDQFVNALGIIAEKKGQALKDVVQPILQAEGPMVTGTKAGYVKFHDDKVSAFVFCSVAQRHELQCSDTEWLFHNCF